MKYIALLRGINVGGHKIIPMATLRTIFESAGFKNVRTYIQSGNVVFDAAAKNSASVRLTVEQLLSETLHYTVPVLIRTAGEMKKTVAGNPLAGRHVEKKTKMYVVFLETKPAQDRIAALLATQVKGMTFAVGAREIFCLLDATFKGNDSPFSNTAIEKILGQSTTTRNWNTVTILSTMEEE